MRASEYESPLLSATDERAPDGMNRRAFLRALGISGIATFAACSRYDVEHAIPFLVPPEEITPGVSLHYASTCAACPGSCGLLTTVRDGRPIKLEGLASHPTSRGGLCANGQAYLRGLYDAGRLRGPRARGAAIPWTELDRTVRARLADARASNRGVYVVSRPIVSPTSRRAIEGFLAPYGGRLVEYHPGIDSASAVREAYRFLDGRDVLPDLAIDRADLLLVLGADLLGSGDNAVAHTARYADRRRAAAEGTAFRHIQFEANLTITGAAANERIPATARERRHFAIALLGRIAAEREGVAAALGRELAGSVTAPDAHTARLRALSGEMLRADGRCLVVSGSRDPAEQIAVALINRILGNEGSTLDLENPAFAGRGSDADLIGFLTALDRGSVGAAFFLDCNPVEELSRGAEIASQLTSLPLAVAITDRPTGTAAACEFVAASHHGLECWGDAAPRRDVLTLMQPAIRPLFETRHPVENFLVWSGARTTDYRLHLRDEWREFVYAGDDGEDFDAFWTRAVSEGGASPEVSVRANDRTAFTSPAFASPDELRRAFRSEEPPADGFEAELFAEVGLRDGRSSFNPWLRELPDPIARTSWLGMVRIAPALAREAKIADGDVVEIRAGDVSLEIPARIVPGQHPRVLGIPVGYGLRDGDGGVASRNGYRLARTNDDGVGSVATPIRIRRTGRAVAVPTIQPHGSAEGRPIIHEVARHDEAIPRAHYDGNASFAERRAYSPRWEMIIDLDACTGCGACVVACQAENNIAVVGPENMAKQRDMYWLRIDRYFDGSEDDPVVHFEPMLCAQCGNAPCENVCPVAATVHSHEGLNQQVYNRCVGTRYCANNCPYKVRRFNWFDFRTADPLERMVLNPDVVVRERGVMEKCTFCVQRIQRARIEAKGEGGSAPITVETACQQSCPARAISFGDGSRPDGDIAARKGTPRAFRVLDELGVDPSITYLARVRDRGRNDSHGGHA